jgi:hypothetical protein
MRFMKFALIQSVPGGMVNILGGHSIVILNKKVYVYICPTPNDFQARVISRYRSKIDNIEIISTYCF